MEKKNNTSKLISGILFCFLKIQGRDIRNHWEKNVKSILRNLQLHPKIHSISILFPYYGNMHAIIMDNQNPFYFQ